MPIAAGHSNIRDDQIGVPIDLSGITKGTAKKRKFSPRRSVSLVTCPPVLGLEVFAEEPSRFVEFFYTRKKADSPLGSGVNK